jgi:hydroxymethylpyrimidine/phosphomethylpyrimidine kinase
MTIAGSDSSCGAGAQADLRVFSACGVFGTTILTALTAQSPEAVTAVQGLDADFVEAQLRAVLSSLPVSAIKTGMLWSQEVIERVVDVLQAYPEVPLVVDPVMIATSGARLVTESAIACYQQQLLPLATVITPNIDEAEVFLGYTIERANQEQAARELSAQAGAAVLLKGGHLGGAPTDLLCDGEEIIRWEHAWIDKVNTHGSGCMLSAAICAELGKGKELSEAVGAALSFLQVALQHPFELHPELYLAGVEGA